MRILAIDPGHTTGWCKIEVEDEKPKYIFSGNFDRFNIDHAMRGLFQDSINKVVIERLPYNLPPIMGKIKSDIEYSFITSNASSRPIFTAPAEWKPITRRYPLPKLDWRTSQHERDAWRMGVFWLWKEGLVKI